MSCRVCVLFTVLFVIRLSKTSPDVLFPYGKTTGDRFLPPNDDGSSDAIPLSHDFTFFDSSYDKLYVNTNGAVSFLNPVANYTPSSFPLKDWVLLTPFWADVDTTIGGSIEYREVGPEEKESFDVATQIIQEAFIDQREFIAEWLFIVTWDRVAFYQSRNAHIVNTFQCVLVSCSSFSAVIFNYESITWTTGFASGGDPSTGLGGLAAQVGFNAGDGKHYYAIPESRTEDILNVTQMSNVGLSGRFVFRVDTPQIHDVACTSNGSLQVYPDVDSMLGGTEVNISGPCFNMETNHVLCKFGDEVVRGVVVNEQRAKCITPFQQSAFGFLSLQLSLDDGVTFPFHTDFLVVFPVYASPHVFKGNEVDWLNSDSLTVIWDPKALGSDVENVDIAVFEYSESKEQGTIQWQKSVTLAQNVSSSSGEAQITKPFVNAQSDHLGLMGAIVIYETDTYETSINKRSIWSSIDSLQWLYPRDSVSWCQRWTEQEFEDMSFLEERPPCPCSMKIAIIDFAHYFPLPICRAELWGQLPSNCAARPGAYHCVVSRDRSVHGAGQECCYKPNGDLIESRTDPSGFGFAHRFYYAGSIPGNNVTKVPFFSHFYFDVIPGKQCCKYPFIDNATSRKDAIESCNRYKAVRPSVSCAQYSVPTPAALYGTVHFVTPDGFNYTFNGQGEYTVLRIEGGQFVLQGRIERLAPDISVSVLTALAAKTTFGDIIHIQSSRRRVIDVFIKRHGLFELLDNKQSLMWPLNGCSVTFGHDISREGVFIVFDNGIGLHVNSSGPSLGFVITLPQSFRGATEGLLGRWNGIPTDDLQLPNGTILPDNSSIATIHNIFGPSWIIQGEESCFYYLPGYSTNTYSSASYQPEFNATYIQIPSCSSSVFCNMDYNATGSIDIAMATLYAEMNLIGIKADLTVDPNSCQDISPPLHGSISTDSTHTVGGQLLFNCSACYELVGNQALTCENSLVWNGEPPICHQQSNGTCPYPHPVGNGTVTIDHCLRTALFKCDINFTMIGQSKITCDDSSSWSADFPLCEDKNRNSTAVSRNHGRRHLWWLLIFVVVMLGVIILGLIIWYSKRKE